MSIIRKTQVIPRLRRRSWVKPLPLHVITLSIVFQAYTSLQSGRRQRFQFLNRRWRFCVSEKEPFPGISNLSFTFPTFNPISFQITCHVQVIGDAQFVKTPEGFQKITSFHLHFYGVKHDCPTQTIRVEQSQSDRSKKPFHPVLWVSEFLLLIEFLKGSVSGSSCWVLRSLKWQ